LIEEKEDDLDKFDEAKIAEIKADED